MRIVVLRFALFYQQKSARNMHKMRYSVAREQQMYKRQNPNQCGRLLVPVQLCESIGKREGKPAIIAMEHIVKSYIELITKPASDRQ